MIDYEKEKQRNTFNNSSQAKPLITKDQNSTIINFSAERSKKSARISRKKNKKIFNDIVNYADSLDW